MVDLVTDTSRDFIRSRKDVNLFHLASKRHKLPSVGAILGRERVPTLNLRTFVSEVGNRLQLALIFRVSSLKPILVERRSACLAARMHNRSVSDRRELNREPVSVVIKSTCVYGGIHTPDGVTYCVTSSSDDNIGAIEIEETTENLSRARSRSEIK